MNWPSPPTGLSAEFVANVLLGAATVVIVVVVGIVLIVALGRRSGSAPCEHPAAALHVESGEVTVVPDKKFPDEYEIVTYNLYCRDCQAPVKVGYARLKPEIAAADKARHEQVMAESKKHREEIQAFRAQYASRLGIGEQP